MPITDLYFAIIPDKTIDVVYPNERQKYIENTSNKKTRNQRYFVWKLLEYAIKNSFGIDFNKIEFDLTKQGKWSCKDCCFSLSHSGNVVAVAVSNSPVGVDTESLDRTVSSSLCRRILSDKETNEYCSLNETDKNNYLIKKWTQKESLFKMGSEKTFRPKELNADDFLYTDKIDINNISFFYSVANNNIKNLRVFTDIKL